MPQSQIATANSSAPQPTLVFRRATEADAERIADLLARSGDRCVHERASWIAQRCHFYRVATEADGRLLACAALLPTATDALELRSVSVASDCRGRGLATHLLARLCDHADRASAPIRCRSADPGFFERFGFEVLHEEPETTTEGRRRFRLQRTPRAASPTNITHRSRV